MNIAADDIIDILSRLNNTIFEPFALSREISSIVENSGVVRGDEFIPKGVDFAVKDERFKVGVEHAKAYESWGFIATILVLVLIFGVEGSMIIGRRSGNRKMSRKFKGSK